MIGYLYDSATRRHLFFGLFADLIRTWATQQSIANTSYEQHLYITKTIIVCLSFVSAGNDTDKARLSNGMLIHFLPH
jgi:hypothetical protein